MHRPGLCNYPVRLAQEIFLRCIEYMPLQNELTLYDPCCGGGYLLTVLGLLNYNKLSKIIGSDIDAQALEAANVNIHLLTKKGMQERVERLHELYNLHQKQCYIDALKSADRLADYRKDHWHQIDISLFKSDALHNSSNRLFSADIIFTDVPYGNLVCWDLNDDNILDTLLNNMIPLLKKHSVIAISSDKSQKIKNNQFIRLEKMNIGKRKIEILKYKA